MTNEICFKTKGDGGKDTHLPNEFCLEVDQKQYNGVPGHMRLLCHATKYLIIGLLFLSALFGMLLNGENLLVDYGNVFTNTIMAGILTTAYSIISLGYYIIFVAAGVFLFIYIPELRDFALTTSKLVAANWMTEAVFLTLVYVGLAINILLILDIIYWVFVRYRSGNGITVVEEVKEAPK